MAIALKCTRCGATSLSSLFYRGPDAHVCRTCAAPFVLADAARDRRIGRDRRVEHGQDGAADWRSGEERRHTLVPA